jgi:hypothetical protein
MISDATEWCDLGTQMAINGIGERVKAYASIGKWTCSRCQERVAFRSEIRESELSSLDAIADRRRDRDFASEQKSKTSHVCKTGKVDLAKMYPADHWGVATAKAYATPLTAYSDAELRTECKRRFPSGFGQVHEATLDKLDAATGAHKAAMVELALVRKRLQTLLEERNPLMMVPASVMVDREVMAAMYDPSCDGAWKVPTPAPVVVDPKLLKYRYLQVVVKDGVTKVEGFDALPTGDGHVIKPRTSLPAPAWKVQQDPRELGPSGAIQAVADERARANEVWGPSDEDLLADDEETQR